MCELNELVLETRCYPHGSFERQKRLNLIIAKMQRSTQIWKAPNVPRDDYQEALQQTWLWFCENLDRYDPSKAGVMTWFNNNLRFKILNRWQEIQRQRANFIDLETPLNKDEAPSMWNIPDSRPEPSTLMEDLLEWLEKNKKELKRIHVRNCPDVNCYILIRCRLPPEPIPWETLSKELKAAVPTLSGFYQRECITQLQRFAREGGYHS